MSTDASPQVDVARGQGGISLLITPISSGEMGNKDQIDGGGSVEGLKRGKSTESSFRRAGW